MPRIDSDGDDDLVSRLYEQFVSYSFLFWAIGLLLTMIAYAISRC